MTGATTTNSVIGPDGSRLAIAVGGTLNWYLFDVHGDVAGQVPTTGSAAVRAYRYKPFGEALTAQGTGLSSPWGYQGALNLSPNAGADHALLDIGARNYATSLGAWTSLDTVLGSAQNPLSMNRFAYAEANPTSLVDPTGHNVCTSGNYPNCDKIDPKVWSPPPPPPPASGTPPGSASNPPVDICARYGECGRDQPSWKHPDLTTPVAQPPGRDCSGINALGCLIGSPDLGCEIRNTPYGQSVVCHGPSDGDSMPGGGGGPIGPFGGPYAFVGDPADIAQRIAEHGGKHLDQFLVFEGFDDIGDLAELVEGTLISPDDFRDDGPGGKEAFWNDFYDAIVIWDPNNPDGGTVFRPDRGKEYFDDPDLWNN